MKPHTRAVALATAMLATPTALAAAVTGNAMNPAMSLILDMRLASSSEDPAAWTLPGFQPGPEVGPDPDGFALGEAELNLSSNIDDSFYGNLVAAIAEEDGEGAIELEEAWIQTTALPGGFTVKAGKLFSRVGYLNEKHPHAWDFVDAPLAYDAFYAGNLKDTGVQARWVAPTDLYLELGVEAFAGEAFPAAGRASGGKGMYTVFAKLGGDWDDSNSWQLGVSGVDAEADGRVSEPADPALDPTVAFTGDSTLFGVDFVWKWSPDGNFKQRNLVFSTEYMTRDESGSLEVLFPLAGAPEAGAYAGTQDGYYAQLVYQWRPQWRIGLRYDRLASDNVVSGLSAPIVLDDDAHAPTRVTVKVDFSHTEFSRFRLQLARDEAGPVAADRVILQYIVSMGPHGAHQY